MQASTLTDGAGHAPAYSLRTLCRALDYARCAASGYGLQRSLWDGWAMAFLTQLGPGSAQRLERIMQEHLLQGGGGGAAGVKVGPGCRLSGRTGMWLGWGLWEEASVFSACLHAGRAAQVLPTLHPR